MTIQIGGIPFRDSMANRALSYLFSPPQILARNGKGEAQTAGGCSLQWTWATLDPGEWAWLTARPLGGYASKAFDVTGGTVLYDDEGNERTFNYCVVLRPSAKDFNGMYHREVTLLIDTLYP